MSPLLSREHSALDANVRQGNIIRVYGGRRSNLGKHEGLKRALTEAPDVAVKLLGDVLERCMLDKAHEV